MVTSCRLLIVSYHAARKTQSGPLICISNVHIFSNPKFPDVKLWQTHALVKQVSVHIILPSPLLFLFVAHTTNSYRPPLQIERIALTRNLPVILCGDFNSEPVSAVYEFMTRNHISVNHPDLSAHANIYATMDLEHNVSFASAYASVFGSEPEYTNYTGACCFFLADWQALTW